MKGKFGSLIAHKLFNRTIISKTRQQSAQIASLSRRESVVGELSDLAPEFIGGKFTAIDPATDVVRMVMAGYDLFDEYGVRAHLVGLNDAGVVQIYLSAQDGKLYAAGGEVILNDFGVVIAASDNGHLAFSNDGGVTKRSLITQDAGDTLQIVNYYGGLYIRVDGAAADMVATLGEDDGQVNRLLLNLIAGSQGFAANFGGDARLMIFAHDGLLTGGNTYIEIGDARSTPPGPGANKATIWHLSDALRFKSDINADVLHINDGGGLDVVDGNVRSHSEISQPDDGVVSITPSKVSGVIAFFGHTNDASIYGFVSYRTDTPLININAGGANLEVTTGVLTGTTGVDTKFTISAHTDGKLYFENRRGAVRTWFALLI